MGFEKVKKKASVTKGDEAEVADNLAEDRAERVAPTESAFERERRLRAEKYLTKGAGVNQGDQRNEAAKALEDEARKRQGSRWRPNEEERALRDTATKMRGE